MPELQLGAYTPDGVYMAYSLFINGSQVNLMSLRRKGGSEAVAQQFLDSVSVSQPVPNGPFTDHWPISKPAALGQLGLEASFPGKPSSQEISFGAKSKADLYSAEYGPEIFAVAVSPEVPETAILTNPTEIKSGRLAFLEGVMKPLQADAETVNGPTEQTIDGVDVSELECGSSTGMVIRVRTFLHGKRLIALVVGFPKAMAKSNEVATFMTSFRDVKP
jgi:hypothetical protein